MCRAAVFVDIDAVGRYAQVLCLKREAREQLFRRRACCAVGAVEGDLDRLQTVHRRCQMVQIHIHQLRAVVNPADFSVRAGRKLSLLQNQRLNFRLQLVAELEALRREHLDAVMLKRIVGRRNDNACVRLLVYRQIGDRRRRNHAEPYRIAAAGSQSCQKRRFEHVGGNARVLADDDGRLR